MGSVCALPVLCGCLGHNKESVVVDVVVIVAISVIVVVVVVITYARNSRFALTLATGENALGHELNLRLTRGNARTRPRMHARTSACARTHRLTHVRMRVGSRALALVRACRNVQADKHIYARLHRRAGTRERTGARKHACRIAHT